MPKCINCINSSIPCIAFPALHFVASIPCHAENVGTIILCEPPKFGRLPWSWWSLVHEECPLFCSGKVEYRFRQSLLSVIVVTFNPVFVNLSWEYSWIDLLGNLIDLKYTDVSSNIGLQSIHAVVRCRPLSLSSVRQNPTFLTCISYVCSTHLMSILDFHFISKYT